MTDQAATREELAKIASVVLTARKLLASGTLLDLSAVEERVRQLCQDIAELPPGEGLALRQEALALLDRLTLLEQDLREQLAEVTRDLGD